MGLDMYLSKRHYVKAWEHTPQEDRHEVKVLKGGKEDEKINSKKISYVIEDVFQWRKANAIHKWFVDNIQDGEDDCRDAYIGDLDNLKPLLEKCEQVIKLLENAKTKTVRIKIGWNQDGDMFEDFEVFDCPDVDDILPSQSGFFFGGTDYDEWYLQNLQETVKMLKEELAIENNFADYYYSSSW